MKYLLLIILTPLLFSCSQQNYDADIAIVKKYVESVENLDYTGMADLLAENYEGYGPSAGDTIRKAAAIENWKKSVDDLYKSISYQRSQFAGVSIAEGPNVGIWVANWAELIIEYKGEKGSATIWANTNYKVENGKIVKSITFYNEADVLDQLGYVFINPNDL